MIERIELALSDRTCCNDCGILIDKNTLRGIETEQWKYTTTKYYCKKCARKIIKQTIEEQNNLLNELK